MHKIVALFRASALTAASYRLSLVLSIVGLIAAMIPVYFVATALQPTMASTIGEQGGNYFAFILTGIFLSAFLVPATTQFANLIANGIATGTLEAMLSTSTRVPTLMFGLLSYSLSWQVVRGGVLLLVGTLLGAKVLWGHMLFGSVIVALTILAYLSVGILAAALVLLFRTSGPITPIVLALSTFLGGVYYPTHVIPSWIQKISAFIPLTYGLRALRRTLLNAEPFSAYLPDVLILVGFVISLLGASSALFVFAFQHARRAGTLTHY